MDRNPIKKWLLIIFLSLFVIYSVYEFYNLILGPKIYLDAPKDGESFTKSLVEVKGSAKNVAFITLNGKPIFLDTNGKINEKLILFPGYNIMTIDAEDRFKRKTEKRLQLFLEGEMPKIENLNRATSTEKISATSTASTTEATSTASTSPQTSTTTDIINN